ncbi:hypothetical protein CgunFtcFv8_020316 [Champsocephalus gunnari]|nr:hypothetical protein CgunFtcFv8_020316 [Champsocephalus gunnari]
MQDIPNTVCVWCWNRDRQHEKAKKTNESDAKAMATPTLSESIKVTSVFTGGAGATPKQLVWRGLVGKEHRPDLISTPRCVGAAHYPVIFSSMSLFASLHRI